MKFATALLTTLTLALGADAPAQTAGLVTISPVELHGQHIATHDGACHACSATVPFVGYRTFSQQAWGRRSGEAAALRDAYFHRAFPYGLTIGDARVAPGPTFGLQFTTPYGVECFLPNEWDETSLHVSAVNPVPTYGTGGAFAGRLVAAKLNVEFDRIGVLGLAPHATLGEMILVGGVDRRLRGLTVDHLIEIADQTIAGVFGHLHNRYDMRRCCVDVDGDGYPDVSADDVFDALRTVNKNFRDGCDDRGHLAVPFCNACRQVTVYRPPVVCPPPVKTVVHVGTCHLHGKYAAGSPCATGACAPPSYGKVVVHPGKGHAYGKHGHTKSVSVGVFASQAKSKGKTKSLAPLKTSGRVVVTAGAKTSKKAKKKTSDPHGAVPKRARLSETHPRRVFRAVDG